MGVLAPFQSKLFPERLLSRSWLKNLANHWPSQNGVYYPWRTGGRCLMWIRGSLGVHSVQSSAPTGKRKAGLTDGEQAISYFQSNNRPGGWVANGRPFTTTQRSTGPHSVVRPAWPSYGGEPDERGVADADAFDGSRVKIEPTGRSRTIESFCRNSVPPIFSGASKAKSSPSILEPAFGPVR